MIASTNSQVLAPLYTPKEEKANILTHALAVLFFLVAAPMLIYRSIQETTVQERMGLIIFGLSLVLVYVISTIYHSISNPRLKYRLRILDHISIYFLIAGTHTPFLIFYLNNATGRFYLFLLWGMVLIGMLYKLFLFGRFRGLSVIFYLVMGWMAVFTLPPMLDQMSDNTLFWIVSGGIIYTFGVVFYIWRRLPYNHAVWHVFAMTGSIAHFLAVWSLLD